MILLLNYSRARSKERLASGCCRRVSTFQMFRIYRAEKMKSHGAEFNQQIFFFIIMSRFIKKFLVNTRSDFRSPTSPLRMLHFLLDFAF
jgi:hypothetical protein